MRFGIKTVALVTILALHAVTSVQATPNLTGYPNSMAATGDSITRAYNTATLPFSDAPRNSWSTGTRVSVESHYTRILVAQPAILGRNYNHAVTGAKMVGLEAQMQQVNDRGVAYVTILMGANDLCTRTVAGMTSVADFRSQFERAMAVLSAGSPRARIYVVSIPAVYRLLLILKDNFLARLAWRTFDICQSGRPGHGPPGRPTPSLPALGPTRRPGARGAWGDSHTARNLLTPGVNHPETARPSSDLL
jgi:lysophospholipase L1-like esterase